MQSKQVEQIVEQMAAPIAAQQGVEVEDVEFVKEGPRYFLRVYLDREGGVTIDDCEAVSRALSDALDQNDPTDAPYYLEVSSPGLDRPLYKPKHFAKYMGRRVEVKFYKPHEGQKQIDGTLVGFENNMVTVESSEGSVTFPQQDAALIRLYVEI